MLAIKEVFHLTNRGVEGFVRSLFKMLKVDLPVPDHSTLSKRGKTLKVKLPRRASGSLNLVVESIGLKVYGEGEWKVRKHGYSKRRTWRKLHLGADPETGEIQAACLTENNISDDAEVKAMLEQIPQPLLACAADGAYDKRKVYDAINLHSPEVEILIPRHVRTHASGSTAIQWRTVSNAIFRTFPSAIDRRQRWKDDSGYHMRSLAETAMFRLKIVFGAELSARLQATQTTQALIRCAALNTMTHLGMSQSYKVS